MKTSFKFLTNSSLLAVTAFVLASTLVCQRSVVQKVEKKTGDAVVDDSYEREEEVRDVEQRRKSRINDPFDFGREDDDKKQGDQSQASEKNNIISGDSKLGKDDTDQKSKTPNESLLAEGWDGKSSKSFVSEWTIKKPIIKKAEDEKD